MPGMREIKAKIKSLKGTKRITSAMKAVSAAKLRKAQQELFSVRPYADVMKEIAKNLFKRGNPSLHPVFKERDVKRIEIVAITADKGLCGGFNHQTIKAVSKLLKEFKEKDVKVRLRGIGRKGIEYFKFNEYELSDEKIGLSASPDYEEASNFIKTSYEDFMNGETDQVILVHNGYVNKIVQEIRIDTLLPLKFEKPTEENQIVDIEPKNDEEKVLTELVQKYVEFSQFFALLDSLAAEHSARMQAMDAATNNASEKVKELTLAYNKARQEAVTTELIEIISGMEALKK